MRIALIEAQDPQRPQQVHMPMGLAYIKSWLEHGGAHQVNIAMSPQEVLSDSPQIIGISSVSPNFCYAQELADLFRQHSSAVLILGGAHISSVPHSLPPQFLAGVIGEGEITFGELVEALSYDLRPRPSTLRQIPGLVFHSESPTGPTTELSSHRQLLADLDVLPHPSYTWLPTDQPAPPLWSFSSRGCPYRCTFCSTSSFWERYRLHSVAYVTEELRQIVETYNPSLHLFMDDLFAANTERLREFRASFQAKLPRIPSFVATVRADLVTEATCQALKELGVVFCHLGLESASDRVLTYLKNHTTTADINQQALDLMQRYGLSAVGSFIIGAPNEEEEDIAATWRFIDSNLQAGKLKSFSFGPLVAFPGTKIWNDACQSGLIDPAHIDWRSLDIDLRAFDRQRYTLLSPLPRERFNHWFDRFLERWQRQFSVH